MSRIGKCASAALIGLGLLLSAYLVARSFWLLANADAAGVDVCSMVFGKGCDATLLSSSSWLLGIPLGGWGLVYFTTLAGLLMLGAALGEGFQDDAITSALVLACAGAVASVVLTALMLISFAPFCPVCLAVHVVNLLLLASVKAAAGCSIRELLSRLRAGLAYAIGRRLPNRDTAWKALAFLTAILMAIVSYQWVYIESALRVAAARQAASPEDVIKAYEGAPVQEVSVYDGDPRLGPADAPLQLVIFSSFQCPGCRALAKELPYLAKHFPHDLAIVFKHYPLSTACNTIATRDHHPRACQAAYAAEAAHRQEKFWAFHDALFAAGLADDETTIARVAEQVGLDLEAFDAQRVSSSVAEKIKADVAMGNALHINATPTVFLNGRRVLLTPNALDILVHHLLDPSPNDPSQVH